MKQKVFVTRELPGKGIERLKKAGFEVEVYEKDQIIPRPQLLKRVKGVHAVLSLLTDQIDEKFFAAAGEQLKIVANYAVGFNNIDLAAAKKHGVMVTNTPGKLLTDSVAEHTLALIFALTKRVVEADQFTRAGKYDGWSPTLFLGLMLKGKTLGLIGTGRIGSAVAKRAKAMGMKIVYNDVEKNMRLQKETGAKFLTKDQLLKQADVISLHVPLLPATFHLMGTKELKRMKRSAYLINTSRGPVVDEKALATALEQKQIAGAALDVFECEPAIDCDLSDTHELQKLDNVILTPHIASAALEARVEMADMAVLNVIDALKGKRPKNLVK